ncbi:MAG TPA: hypothetical protein VFA60_01145 [Terriglobales bacterium]|nr:hypothetical protein [Terriglobales bacterium]
MVQKFINKLQYRAERVVVWALRRCLTGYSAVVACEVARINAEHRQLRAEAQFVAADHWRHLNELHARLTALEKR